MMTQKRSCWQSRSKAVIFVLSVTLLLYSPPRASLFAAEQNGRYATVQYTGISLTHISAKQGIKYLTELRLGTVSHIRGTNVLLLTGRPHELNKAVAVLKLVDAKEQFTVKALFPASKAKSLPSNKQIAARVGDILIGDFSNPPTGVAAAKAIIDIHNNMVVAVAPVSRLEEIISAINVDSKFRGNDKPAPLEVPAKSTLATADNLLLTVPAPAPASADVNSSPLRSGRFHPNEQKRGADVVKPATAVRSYEPGPIPNGDEILTENLPAKLDIVHLLSLAGTYLNLDFVYDPAKVKGDVTLLLQGKLRGRIKVKDLYPILESVLRFKGFVMTRHKENLVTVVPRTEALDIDPELLEAERGKIEYGDLVVTRPFRLEHIDTASAQNLLTNMKLGVSISQIAETKTLIVTDFTYRMPRIEALLKMVDQPGEPKKFRFRQLQYTMARTLAPKLATLAEQLGTISISIAAQPTVSVPTVTRRPGETDASFRARQLAAQRAAQRAAQARARQVPTVKPTEPGRPTVYLDADERTNRILMIGLEEQLNDVEELIDTLDVEQQDLRTLQLYKIKHVDAEEVRKKLQELGLTAREQPVSSRITPTTKTPTKPGTPTATTRYSTVTSRAAEEALVEEPQVVVIEPTNSLLVNATAEQHTQIATIISYVDSETDLEEMPYQLYPLENQSPNHLAEVLQNLIQETVKDKEGKIEKVIRREEEIVIVPDPNTFSLIVYASKKNQEWIANLIEKLDKRRPQVLIDVTLVEISKSDAFNYDLNLISSLPDLTDTSGLTGAILPDVVGGNLVSRLTNSSRDRFIDFQSDSGMATSFYGDRHINALLTAMQEKNYGRILAKPKILVNDNMPGTISTTDTTYVTRTSSIPVTTGAAGQQATLIETQVQFEGYDAGIELTITPHISEGDLLRLDIHLNRSDFGTITGEKPPDTTSSDIETTVTVPDGSTIILGGLLKLNQSKGGTKVPILGDIPLVGGLFRGMSNSDIQKKLYVFVKAEVIRPEDTAYAKRGLERISDRNRRAFEQHEQEFQKYEDWPGIKPKPMDPLKVLEAE